MRMEPKSWPTMWTFSPESRSMEQCLRMETRSEHMVLKVYASREVGDEEPP